MPQRNSFAKHKLPTPPDYYAQRLQLKRGANNWARANCPFHEDSNPSLSVNMITGGYLCHGCGSRGGDVLAFHRQVTGLGFKAAAQDLGAWEVRS